MFTGESDTGAAMNALSAGASGYVVKPASERELLIAIKSAMQQREQALESRERISVLESAGAGDGAVVERMLRDLA